MLALVHIPPAISIAGAVLGAAGIIWYWRRLGNSLVPRSRRWIRRISISLMLIALTLSVWGLSFTDSQNDPVTYLNVWSAVVGLVGLIGLTAFADFFNNMRLLLEARAAMVEQAAADVLEEIARSQTVHQDDRT